MKKIFLLSAVAIIFTSCANKQQQQNQQAIDIQAEKILVQGAIDNYFKLFSSKDSVGIMNSFVPGEETSIFMACDSVPMKGCKAIEDHFKKAFKMCKACKFGTPCCLNIVMDHDARMANAIFVSEMECEMEGMEVPMKHKMIFDLTYAKDSSGWKISQGIVASNGEGCHGKCSPKACKTIDPKCCKDGKIDPKCCKQGDKSKNCPMQKQGCPNKKG